MSKKHPKISPFKIVNDGTAKGKVVKRKARVSPLINKPDASVRRVRRKRQARAITLDDVLQAHHEATFAAARAGQLRVRYEQQIEALGKTQRRRSRVVR